MCQNNKDNDKINNSGRKQYIAVDTEDIAKNRYLKAGTYSELSSPVQ